MGSDILRSHHEDDVDAVGGERHRLSHAAAKHKMAIRPVKKKGPTRQHRMTLEVSGNNIAPTWIMGKLVHICILDV